MKSEKRKAGKRKQTDADSNFLSPALEFGFHNSELFWSSIIRNRSWRARSGYYGAGFRFPAFRFPLS